MPPTNGFTPNAVWADTTPTSFSEELTLPSGQTCRAHRLEVTDLIEAGILDNADELTGLVDERYLKDAKRGKQPDTAEMLKDVGKLRPIITMADKAIPLIVESPVVKLHYVTAGTSTRALTEDERAQVKRDIPGVVFTDQIGLEDKVFLFDWGIGNLAAMRAFREDTSSDVAGVADGKRVRRPAKRTGSRRK